jgi:hypothetical protein
MSWLARKTAFDIAAQRFPELSHDREGFDKALENWTSVGKECPIIKQRSRIGFDDVEYEKWLTRIKESLITLDKQDYLKCFNFAVEAYYVGPTRSDFRRGETRDAGKVLHNHIGGKLGEMALKKMLEKYDLEIELDFDISGMIPSQDIAAISVRRGIRNNPAVKVSIKGTKLKNIMLAVPESEIALADRRSDIYVLTGVGLFDDHLLRLLKRSDIRISQNVGDLIPEFTDIHARVIGWVSYRDLISTPPLSVEEIKRQFKQEFAKPNYIRRSGELSTDWKGLRDAIVDGLSERQS